MNPTQLRLRDYGIPKKKAPKVFFEQIFTFPREANGAGIFLGVYEIQQNEAVCLLIVVGEMTS